MTPRDSDFYMLSADEQAELDRAKRNRSLCCSDGRCGGCPRCGYFPVEPEDDES